MTALRDFVADALESEGAAVERIEPDGLEVLAPAAVRSAMGWPELARLGFGTERQDGAIPIGLEGDWLDRFDTLFGERGHWAERQLAGPVGLALAGPERVVEHALELPNAVWRLQGVTTAWTRCLLLGFRYVALSDEKREGLIRLGFNLGTGAPLGEAAAKLHAAAEGQGGWQAPDAEMRQAAGAVRDANFLEARLKPLLADMARRELEPFLKSMRRRLDRDLARIRSYYEDLHGAARNRMGIAAAGDGSKAGRRREELRLAAIEREYRAKLDDLRNNYALRIAVTWVQALDLYVPAHRISLLIRRRKQERLIHLDWHPSIRMAEPPVCDWGLGLGRRRLVCDESLHLTDEAGQAPCPGCGKAWCRACKPQSCPRCGRATEVPG